SDIGGSETQKERFDEIIGWPLHHPEMIEQLDLPAQKGVLLYGPPGCSKTMTAQAVAATYKLNFIAVKGAELISMYVGESERAVREVFRKAKQAAPCVIFFDEIDSIGSERESGGAKGLNVLTTLLNEMDGFEAMKDVLVLAATNKPEVLDPALLRPGRFDQHVYVGLPNTDARKDILQISLRKVPVATTDFDSLVAATEGYSGAEIVCMCGVAKRAAARRMISGATEVQIEEQDLKDAIAVTRKGVTEEMLKSYDDFARAGAC
ncbi:AAA-domain-containing protein, partial [Hortaea werneckii]